MKNFNIKDELPEDVLHFLDEVVERTVGYDVYLGGGYIRDMYWNRKQGYKHNHGYIYKKEDHEQPKQPKDLDLFFIPHNTRSEDEELPTIPKTFINYDVDAKDIPNCRTNVLRVRGLYCRELLVTKDVQFIVYDKYLSMEDLADDMDTSINQVMYNIAHGGQYLSEVFIESHKSKTITMMHDFEEERMFNRLVRMQKKFPDYKLVHNISEEKWDKYKGVKEKKIKSGGGSYSGGSGGSFVDD